MRVCACVYLYAACMHLCMYMFNKIYKCAYIAYLRVFECICLLVCISEQQVSLAENIGVHNVLVRTRCRKFVIHSASADAGQMQFSSI